MKKYRRKPMVLEAAQLGRETSSEIKKWSGGHVIPYGNMFWQVSTQRGVVIAQKGDWIIKGISGDFYPCKADIFPQTYEEVFEEKQLTIGDKNES